MKPPFAQLHNKFRLSWDDRDRLHLLRMNYYERRIKLLKRIVDREARVSKLILRIMK